MVWAALKDAPSKGRSLSIVWLDLANPYGSVSHVLILFALRRYKIPEDWITVVIKYCDGLWGRKGIFAGCTITVVMFLAAFNVTLEYVSQAGLP